MVAITRMKVEDRTNPVGIDEQMPVFGWNVDTDIRNWKQEAYQILVSDDTGRLDKDTGNLWDSGKTESSSMVQIPYQGKPLQPAVRYYWKVRIWSNGTVSDYSTTAFFEMGLSDKHLWQGSWIGETDEREHHIYRKVFQTAQKVKAARAYICGLGHYELLLNGKKVSDYVLQPGWTNYEKSCLYNVYDVTDMLKQGDNAVGVLLGDGMYHVPGKKGRYAYFPRSYGKSKFLLQLNITYEDGTVFSVASDENFRRARSPIEYCCIYGGEEYYAEYEQEGYADADFIEDDSWEAAVMADAPAGELTAQTNLPLKVMQQIQPVEVKEIKPGFYLYDLGKNFSGWVRIKISAGEDYSGSRIKMKPGEILKEDGTPDQKATGKNYSWDYYLNAGREQEYAPKFTYTGFRYVQVEGAVPREFADGNEAKPVLESLIGEFIYPEMESLGEFHCSNELYNQIHGIITQAMLSNIKSVFTDCPHREKLGWLEQTHLIGPAIMYNYDVHRLYEKVEKDMEESQHENGLVPDICPEYITGFEKYHTGYVDSPEWGSAVIINPWYIYKKYGDVSIFSRYYDTMKKYMDYLTGKTHHHILHHGLGDWLDIGPMVPHSQNTPVPVIATAIYYYDLTIMEKVAGLLGRPEDAHRYRNLKDAVKQEYNLQFYDDQTYRYATGSQAAQAMSLVTGLVAEKNEEKVLEYLIKDIKARGYATTAGDIGHPFVTAALILYNRSDIMNEMMKITDKPGYGYQVKYGATTLTEEWDGPLPERPHGSQNHFMLGSGEEWFFAGLAGIRCIRQEMLFDELEIAPHIADNVDEVEAWHMHPYGKVMVHWLKQDGMAKIDVQIPPNTTAAFRSPADGSRTMIGSGYHTFTINL